jgi:hypothetical protein
MVLAEGENADSISPVNLKRDERTEIMSAEQNRNDRMSNESEQREAGRKGSDRGHDSVGAVDGIGGAGGSSGTGGVRAKARAVGDVSGIEDVSDNQVPAPGSVGKGKSGSRARQVSDGGLRGRTRGDDGETVPNQESAAQQDQEETDASDR